MHAMTDDLPARIAAFIDEELRTALNALAGAAVSDQDVHNARKSLKKARGGLRLYRPSISEEMFREHNLSLRDAGRLLSPLRDGHSQLQLFHSFEDDTWLPSARIESALYADLSQARHTFDTTNARERCAESIGKVRDALGAVAPADVAACIDGLRRIYRNGRRALGNARKKDSASRRHELRKQAKYLRVALEIIDAPEYEHALHRARRVASGLGEDHDLAVLRERISQTGDGLDASDTHWPRRIKARQEKLQKKAFAKAEELFDENAQTFVANLRSGDGN
jgi:CHAD domain-containing protein